MVPVTSLAFTHSARIAFGIKTALKRASRLRGRAVRRSVSWTRRVWVAFVFSIRSWEPWHPHGVRWIAQIRRRL